MQSSKQESADYAQRAQKEVAEARVHLKNGYLETALSTAYYSCFYAIHSKLAFLGIIAKSHKQAGIEFRRQYVKTGLMDKKFSRALNLLSEWRETVDYVPLPDVDPQKAKELVAMAEEFVVTLLGIK